VFGGITGVGQRILSMTGARHSSAIAGSERC
jgi:hypothetical protein